MEDVLVGSFLATKENTKTAKQWILDKDPNPSEEELKEIVLVASRLLRVLRFLD